MHRTHDPLQLLLLLVEHHTAHGSVDVRAGRAGRQHDLHHQIHHHQRIALQLRLGTAANTELQLAPHAVLALGPGEVRPAEEVQLDVAHFLDGVVHHLVVSGSHRHYIEDAIGRAELKRFTGVEASAVHAGMQEHALDAVRAAQVGDDVRTLVQLVLHAQRSVGRDIRELALARLTSEKKRYVVTVALTYSMM